MWALWGALAAAVIYIICWKLGFIRDDDDWEMWDD